MRQSGRSDHQAQGPPRRLRHHDTHAKERKRQMLPHRQHFDRIGSDNAGLEASMPDSNAGKRDLSSPPPRRATYPRRTNNQVVARLHASPHGPSPIRGIEPQLTGIATALCAHFDLTKPGRSHRSLSPLHSCCPDRHSAVLILESFPFIPSSQPPPGPTSPRRLSPAIAVPSADQEILVLARQLTRGHVPSALCLHHEPPDRAGAVQCRNRHEPTCCSSHCRLYLGPRHEHYTSTSYPTIALHMAYSL